MDVPTLKNLEDEEQQKKNIPEPPPLEISMRTMEADVKSFQQEGGEIPAGSSSQVQTPSAPSEPDRPSVSIPGYQGPEKSIFSRSIDIVPDSLQPTQFKQPEQSKSGVGKTIVIIIGVLIGAIILGFLGYYIIFPLIFKQ